MQGALVTLVLLRNSQFRSFGEVNKDIVFPGCSESDLREVLAGGSRDTDTPHLNFYEVLQPTWQIAQ